MKKINKNTCHYPAGLDNPEKVNGLNLLDSRIKYGNDKRSQAIVGQNISNKNKKAFTLVELIIVITILAILATIAFISFQNYTKDSRDGNRLATITQIEKGLELSVLKTAKYPNPDEVYGTGIYEATTELNYVGYIGENITRLINMNKIPLDPVTENKYVYGVSANHQKYQLATTLENLQTNTLIPTTYANGTQARVTGNYTYPLRLGDYLYSLPSLIFVGSEITSTGFVIDKGSNLPYKLNTQTPENTQTISQQLQQLTGTSATLIFTGVQIPTLTSEEFKNLTEIPEALLALGISNKDLLGTAIFGNSYFSEKSVGSSSSSSSGGGETQSWSCGDTVLAGGETYTTATITGNGGYSACWTTQNMRHGTMLVNGSTLPSNDNTIEKWCYDNNTTNCTNEGGLYTWAEAMGFPATCNTTNCTQVEDTTKSVCGALGDGWSLPTDAQWTALTNAGATGWTGNKLSGIVSSLPGNRSTDSSFSNRGSYGYWWSSMQSDSAISWSHYLYSGNTTVGRLSLNRSGGFSVVCIKN